MALGGVGLTLHDLATLYASLANGGEAVALSHRMGETAAKTAARALLHGKHVAAPKQILSPVAAWYVTDILKDAPPPLNAKGGRFAYKTGTSYGYRDAWAVGYDGKYAIAVWVGRPDGASTPGLVGRLAAAPILFDAFARLGMRRKALPAAAAGRPPRHRLRPAPALEALPRRAAPRLAQGPFLEPRVMIAFPPDRAEVETEEDGPVQLKASGGVLPLTWLVNGAPIMSDPRAPPGDVAARRPRLRQALGDRRQGPCRPRDGASKVGRRRWRAAAIRASVMIDTSESGH